MSTNILMPALSPTMTEGTLARWLKKEGDAVRSGDVIAEIETDKATMEVEAAEDGILGKILVPDGTAGVKVNEPIAVLTEEGEEVSAAGSDAEPPETKATTPPAADAPEPSSSPEAPRESEQSAPAPERASSNGKSATEDRIPVSPLARRMAKQAGIDLSGLKGSGPSGRIVKLDIETAQRGGSPPRPTLVSGAPPGARPSQAAPPRAPQPGPVPPSPFATVPAKPAPGLGPHLAVANSNMRRIIARRLTEAKQTVPHFYVSMDIELDALLKLRSELNAKSPKDGAGAFKLSVNDMVIKAAALALRRVPKVNASWLEDSIAVYEDVDISVAVSIPDGLITPIIRRADQKGLAAISKEMRALVERAKAGKLKPEEFQGGGFSISNMGMYGVSEFTAIINPPQSAILSVAAGLQRPVVKDGAISIATVMTCTLSVDHRVLDGAIGAQWLGAFKAIVEEPLSLML